MQFKQLYESLLERKLTLALAESCTGGLFSQVLTEIPGASEIFKGGVVAYDNSIKEKILQVDSETLKKHGSVSQEVVSIMAKNVRKIMEADVGGAITGIAGPSGGTKDKPIGMVWLGVEFRNETKTFLYHFQGDRIKIRHQAAQKLCELILECVNA